MFDVTVLICICFLLVPLFLWKRGLFLIFLTQFLSSFMLFAVSLHSLAGIWWMLIFLTDILSIFMFICLGFQGSYPQLSFHVHLIAIYAILLNSVFQILFWSCSVCHSIFHDLSVFFSLNMYLILCWRKMSVLRVTAKGWILRISRLLLARNGMNSTNNLHVAKSVLFMCGVPEKHCIILNRD